MRRERRRRLLAPALASCLLAGGCAVQRTDPAEMLALQPESAANRAMETRRFDTSDSDELLSASAAVLQDLGFQVTESVREVGLLRAAKERSAREYGQEIQKALVLLVTGALSVLGGSNAVVVMPTDLHQQINASLVASPLDEAGTRHEVRVLFYRLVWKGDGQSGDQYVRPGEQSMEMIRDREIYQQFFARLQKSVFLEEQKI